MARSSSTAWDTKPHRPIFYGLAARLSDRLAGRRDGKAGIPVIPPGRGEAPNRDHGVTPYLEIRRRHFLDRAERERRHMLNDLDATYRALAALSEEIVGADEKVADIRKRLDAIPEAPPDAALASRNVVEQHAHEALVRARRQREHAATRARLAAQEQQAVDAARALRVRQAELTGAVAARAEILDSRVRQLHEHTLRRCGTYRRRLAHHHPDGAAVIPYLDLALPALPDWSGAPGGRTGAHVL